MGILDFFTQSSSSSSQPAKMNNTQSYIYGDWFNKIYGPFDPEFYLMSNPDLIEKWNSNHPNKQIVPDNGSGGPSEAGLSIPPEAIDWAKNHYNNKGMEEGRPGRNNPAQWLTLEDMLTRTEQESASADQKYLGEMRGNVGKYDSQMLGLVDDKNTANNQYGSEMGSQTDTFIDSLNQHVGTYNNRTNQLIDNLSPTALAAPINIGMGGFKTPFITGTQRYAQGAYGNLNNQQYDTNVAAGQNIFDKQSGLLGLLNQIANTNADNSASYAGTQLDNNNIISQIANTVAQAHGPYKGGLDYLQWLQGEKDSTESLRYGLPGTTTTSTPSPAEIGLGTAKLFTDIGTGLF